MASIALSVIGCIDYLAYGTIFTRVMFLPKKKVMFFWIFFPARKAQDVRREEVSPTNPPKSAFFCISDWTSDSVGFTSE
jgi:hypothetical protein